MLVHFPPLCCLFQNHLLPWVPVLQIPETDLDSEIFLHLVPETLFFQDLEKKSPEQMYSHVIQIFHKRVLEISVHVVMIVFHVVVIPDPVRVTLVVIFLLLAK